MYIKFMDYTGQDKFPHRVYEDGTDFGCTEGERLEPLDSFSTEADALEFVRQLETQ